MDPGIASVYTPIVAKVMISLPAELLARIDREARQRKTTRSAFLRDAALRALGRRDPAALAAALDRSRARFDRAGAFESTELVRADRDTRDRSRL